MEWEKVMFGGTNSYKSSIGTQVLEAAMAFDKPHYLGDICRLRDGYYLSNMHS